MQFVDTSAYNNVAWPAYAAWSSMVALKSSEGIGFADPAYASHRAGALAAGISSILHYHFARPDLGNDPIAEANWQFQTVGAIQPGDLIVLDFEVQDARATADWAYQFLAQQQRNYGKLPVIYASDAYIRARLQDSRLAQFGLWLADWTYDPTARPPCPPPWSSYIGLQYTDQATNIPGIVGTVDADVFLGQLGGQMIPLGWHDDGTTLTAPNGHKAVHGFRSYVLGNSWATDNVPLEEEHSAPGQPGTWQTFAYTALEWDAQNGVRPAPLGQKYLAALQSPVQAANIIQAAALVRSLGDSLTSLSSTAQSALTLLSGH